ncbi:conserved hypothetical protein [Pediculus humanus corporis]|uniref:IRS-type PTB domain-containing protein n=1 Tax=Pediculus humanus subsp. corporis TaxID=121224 RepID=E0W393_PEDHC|nr:uncharacterized protein Phum_PHUM602290 [Pediculus humanus corporis]EEB20099.1 conserved hypothetical protein [Pediculus humanus corporis]
MNVDEHGNHVNPGQLEITDFDLILYQRGKSPIKWPLRTLRRYGFDAEHFSFESGRRCQTGPGIYAFRCRRAEQLFNLLQSRIQTRLNGENEINDNSGNFGNSIINRDSMYLEPAPLRRGNPGSRFSSQNGMTRLSSVGSASGSLGPLSPQSVNSVPLPLDTVPLIPPLPTNRTTNQNLYANEDIIASVTQDMEETNNNKTLNEPSYSPLEPSYLNSTVLDLLAKDDLNNITNGENDEKDVVGDEPSSPLIDNNHLYMNIIPGTDKVAPRLNYIVLDLEPSTGDPPKSPTSMAPPDPTRKLSGGYAAIDFKKTVALSHSVNPNFDTDSESLRKTRHSSNANSNLFANERHNSTTANE